MGNESSQIVKEDDHDNDHALKIEGNSDEVVHSPQPASQDSTSKSSTRQGRSRKDAEGAVQVRRSRKKKSKIRGRAISPTERKEDFEVDHEQPEKHTAPSQAHEEEQDVFASREEDAVTPRDSTSPKDDNGSSHVDGIDENRDVALECNLLAEPSHRDTDSTTRTKPAMMSIRNAAGGTLNTVLAADPGSMIGGESIINPNGLDSQPQHGNEGGVSQPFPMPTRSMQPSSESSVLDEETRVTQVIADSQIDTRESAVEPNTYEDSGGAIKKRKVVQDSYGSSYEKQNKKPRKLRNSMHPLEENPAIPEARVPESPLRQKTKDHRTEWPVTAAEPPTQEGFPHGCQSSVTTRASSLGTTTECRISPLRAPSPASSSAQLTNENTNLRVPGEAATDVASNVSTGKRKRNQLKPKRPLSATNIALSDVEREISSANAADDRPGSWTAVNIVRKIKSPLIGVYRNGDPTTDVAYPKKRKRRLPVDDVPGQAQQVSEKKDKSRTPKRMSKSLIPKSSSKSERNVFVNEVHKVSSTTRRMPSKGDLDMGRFTNDEIETISLVLLKHREMHDLSEFDQNLIIAGKSSDATEIWRLIMDALPRRTRDAIVKVCRRRFHNYGVRGKWTDEEDAELKTLTDAFPKQWVKIGELMSRHHEDCRDRWRNYIVCGTQQKTNATWTETEEQKLREAVQHCCKQIDEIRASAHADNPREEAYPKENIEYVDWQYVSGFLDQTRSRLQCMQKWKRMMERENDNVIDDSLDLNHKSWRIAKASRDYRSMRRPDKLAVLQGIRESQAGREGKIPWARVGDPSFQDKWSIMTRKVAWKSLRRRIPGNETMALQDIVNSLIALLTREAAADAPESGSDEDTVKKNKTPISAEHVDEQDDEDAAAVAASSVVNGSRSKKSKAASSAVNGSRTKKVKAASRMLPKEQVSTRQSPELAGDDADMLLEHDDEAPPTLNGHKNTTHLKAQSMRVSNDGTSSNRSLTTKSSKSAPQENSRPSPFAQQAHEDDPEVNESDSSDDADIPARMPKAREGSIEL